MMWYAWLGSMARKIGSQLAWVGAAIVAGLLFILGMKRKVDKAEDKGIETGQATERARVEQETRQTEQQIKEKADETKDEVQRDTADRDDLLDRMRRESTDYGDKP